MAAPVRVRDTVNKLKEGLQKGLQAQCSRMEVQLPRASLGIEPREKNAPVDIAVPDREAARAILDMFSQLADTTTCVFSTEREAAEAREVWSVGEAGGLRIGAVMGLDGGSGAVGASRAARRMQKKGKKGMGKAAKSKKEAKRSAFKSLAFLDEEDGGAGAGPASQKVGVAAIPEETEVLVVVAPTEAAQDQIVAMHERFGQGTVIIVLNAALKPVAAGGAGAAATIQEVFQTAFYLKEAGDWLVYKEFDSEWQLWSNEGLLGQQTLMHKQDARFFPSQVPDMQEAGTIKAGGGGGGGKGGFGGLFDNLLGGK